MKLLDYKQNICKFTQQSTSSAYSFFFLVKAFQIRHFPEYTFE
jgi:hypothetical protein